MEPAEILSKFIPSGGEEMRTQYDKARTSLKALLAAYSEARAAIESGDDDEKHSAISALKTCVRGFDFDPWDALLEIFGGKARIELEKCKSQLVSALKLLGSAVDHPAELAKPEAAGVPLIESALDRLDRVASSARKRQRLRDLFLYALYLVPAVLAYFLGFYFHFGGDILLKDLYVSWPALAYEKGAPSASLHRSASSAPSSASAALVLTGDYKKRYLADFSRYYFQKDRGFCNFFEKADPAAPSLHFQAVAQVPVHGESAPIASLTARVTLLKKSPFPWRDLDCTPHVSATCDDVSLTVRSDGLGPPMGLTCIGAAANGLVLFRAGAGNLFPQELTFKLADNVAYNIETAQEVEGGKLNRTLYLRLPVKSGAPRPADAFKAQGAWFREISTLKDLSAATRVSYNDEITYSFDYRSLKDESGKTTFQQTLLDGIIYFEATDDLLTYDPRKHGLEARAHDAAAIGEGSSPLVAELAALADAALVDSNHVADGDSSVTLSVVMDVAKLPENEVAVAVDYPAKVIKPGGVIMIDANLHNVTTGTYNVALLINDHEFANFDIETLHPEHLVFDETQVPLFKK